MINKKIMETSKSVRNNNDTLVVSKVTLLIKFFLFSVFRFIYYLGIIY